MVSKLGIREITSKTFVASATAISPNVSRLLLRRPARTRPRRGALGRQFIDDARTHNRLQSHSEDHRATWPSLSAIWAEDVCMLCALRVPRQTTCVSVPLRRNWEEAYVAPVLADASPSCLELRVDMDEFDFTRTPRPDWHTLFGPSAWAVPRLALLVHTRDVTNRHRTICMLVSTLIHTLQVTARGQH